MNGQGEKPRPSGRGAVTDLEALRDENAELKERVAFLEGSAIPIPEEWNLSPLEARLMRVLIAREFVTHDMAFGAMYGGMGDSPHPRAVHQYILRVRRKMARWNVKIQTSWGRGFYIEAATRKALRAGAVHIGARASGYWWPERLSVNYPSLKEGACPCLRSVLTDERLRDFGRID